MRIMALETVAHSGRMDLPFDASGIFVGVAGKAESNGSRGDECDAGDVSADANLVTACTAHGNCRMD
jgi:hypothetical protein